MTAPVRVGVLDDYALVGAGLVGLLAPYADRLHVVELGPGVPPTGTVDLVLHDPYGRSLGTPGEVMRLVGDSGARLVVYTWSSDEAAARRAVGAGAAGWISKALPGSVLAEALLTAHAGGRVVRLDPVVVDGVRVPEDADEWPGRDAGLSARESEVLAMVVQGLSNAEIAERAYISVHTVKSHVRAIFSKIGVGSRSQAMVWGLEHGFSGRRRR